MSVFSAGYWVVVFGTDRWIGNWFHSEAAMCMRKYFLSQANTSRRSHTMASKLPELICCKIIDQAALHGSTIALYFGIRRE